MISIKHALIALLVVTLGCVSQQEPLLYVKIPGHPEAYQFSYDLRETVKISSNGDEAIRNALLSEGTVTFLINMTEDVTVSGQYSVTVTNIIQKLKSYQLYSGNIMDGYLVYVYDDARHVWLNATGETAPRMQGAVVWLDAAAKSASVDFENGAIYVRGDTYQNLVKAGDKLALIFMNVDENTLKNA